MTRKFTIGRALIYTAVILISLACLLPFLMVLGGSFELESEIRLEGYKIIPRTFSLEAYKLLFKSADLLINAYAISITVTVAGTVLSLLVCSLLAYCLSVRALKLRRALSVYVMITMLFNGGMVPWYIICTNVLHLKDTLWALILPMACNAWNVFLLRNYFISIPPELAESARIDGAHDLLIFFRIVLPLSKPVLATVGLMICLGYWNDWWLGLMLIDNETMKPLQLLLRSITSNIQFLKYSKGGGMQLKELLTLPSEGIKLATCIVTIGPIIFVYPFVQKYFVSGIMLGAVKG